MGTILLPKNLGVLSTRLPKPNYSSSAADGATHAEKSKELGAEASKSKAPNEVPKSFTAPPYKVVKESSVPVYKKKVRSEPKQNLQARIFADNKIS